jgi:SAM-dependent methyltransferase
MVSTKQPRSGHEPGRLSPTAVNQAIFDSAAVVDEFRSLEGWTEPGEKAALLSVAPTIRDGRVLDVGVGAGRTTSLLRLATNDYVGIDFSPNMVLACRELNPGADIRVADARDLSQFTDGEFDLVLFSYNGIDAVDHAERAAVLAEFHRVLKPDGLLIFSSLNKDGRSFGERPWQLHRPYEPLRPSVRHAAAFAVRVPLHLPHHVRAYRNWLHNHRQEQISTEWAVSALRSHEFAPLVHFSTLGALVREVGAGGFEAVRVFTSTGDVVAAGAEHVIGPDCFHVVCRPCARVDAGGEE